jgi:hypothetical protein
MTRSIHLALASLLSMSALACGSSEEPPPPPAPLLPTFTNVIKQVINAVNCAGQQCHTTAAGGFQLGTKDRLHAALVDQPATGNECALKPDAGAAAAPFILVVPGDPDQSLLYQKLKGVQSCGKKMPDTAKPLTGEEIELVHDWIADGAKND